ncbi:MAG: lipoyl(octanoyl) transferase LipB [Pseudonocardiales bacterium]|nr:lipoyl(octanoyl) transferase LipB [Pseudonocardiales bacterium]MBV9729961.1 lipoyl(octanoyl) transferase LipB [Pseudonocardiales bacterium]
MSWPIQRVDLGVVDYEQAAQDMQIWVAQRRGGLAGDRLFLLSHPPVITYGPRTSLADLPVEATAIPTVPVDRGGYATYHGPGQLVGYLVINIRDRGVADIVRWLEHGLTEGLAQLGFTTVRRDTPKGSPSLVGVWTPDHRKLCSIGMRIRGGVTSHGFAININPEITAFHQFTACGLRDVTMTSLREIAEEQGTPVPTDGQVRDAVSAALGAS